MPKAKVISQSELETIKALYRRVPTAEIARKLGRSRSAVCRAIERLGLDEQVSLKPSPKPEPPKDVDALSELYFIRDILRNELMAAEGVTVARVAAEYRNTILEIEKREANDGADNDPLADLADALISRASKV